MKSIHTFRQGLKDGLPIGLGYVSVSFTFGMMAVESGLPIWSAVLISATNLTSAGQFAGLALIVQGGTMIEMALTQLIINLRYALMSLSLSQKLDQSLTMPHRLAVSFGVTDEIFAVASGKEGEVGRSYLYGLILIPFLGWTGGTLLGAVASTLLPLAVRQAMGIAIYGMFLAIIIPPARQLPAVCKVVIVAALLSCCVAWLPIFQWISSGFSIILCTLVAAGLGAFLFPIQAESEAVEEKEGA